MRITALVKSHEHVCCRYRVAAFRKRWEARGHQVEIRPWSSGWFLQQLFPSFFHPMDAFLIQRRLLPPWQLGQLRRRVRWLIYDFDDSIYLRSSYNPLGPDCPKRFEQFRNMVQTADVVIAGNHHLREQAAALTEPSKVVQIPTCIDARRYPLARHDPDQSSVKLAWIGSSSTLRGLERIGASLDRLAGVSPRLQLRVICDRSLKLGRLPVDFRAWSAATEAGDLAESDIGISWLPEDGWSAGKCGLKLLQYMAAGLPVIANPVGVQAQLVEHGQTGFLAQTPEEWQDAVRCLAGDPDLRRRMGSAGRSRVEREFQVAHGAAAWDEIWDGLGLTLVGESH